jgi:biotin synthase
MLKPEQAKALKEAGLDFYNHNLDTGPDYYDQVVTTRTYQDRLDTLAAVREAGLATCCGGIVGMGETRRDRAGLLQQLATLPAHPESLPINDLMPIAGTPLGGSAPVDGLEFVRMIAVARLVCPKSVVRLSAGREHMSRELQALCFLAGANSIFVGGRLLTTANPEKTTDEALLADLKMRPMRPRVSEPA